MGGWNDLKACVHCAWIADSRRTTSCQIKQHHQEQESWRNTCIFGKRLPGFILKFKYTFNTIQWLLETCAHIIWFIRFIMILQLEEITKIGSIPRPQSAWVCIKIMYSRFGWINAKGKNVQHLLKYVCHCKYIHISIQLYPCLYIIYTYREKESMNVYSIYIHCLTQKKCGMSYGISMFLTFNLDRQSTTCSSPFEMAWCMENWPFW